MVLSGCQSKQPYVTDSRLAQGLVLVYTGIEGRSLLNEDICKGLAEAGVPYAIELTDWTVGVPGAYLLTLRAQARNRQKAGEIAERIAQYQASYPGRPVVLVGQSGGAAMAVWTAEMMRFEQQVDGIILLAAALSPGYRLDVSLQRSRRGVVSFHSQDDWWFLGMGTTISGTMDGEHSSSAGRVGFTAPNVASLPAGYAKLYQVPWQWQMGRAGHWGGHISTSARGFIREFVAPLVTMPEWNGAAVGRVITGEPARPAARSRRPVQGAYGRF
jgi:pimeloyl-ACP methyl ester carboxylesterase